MNSYDNIVRILCIICAIYGQMWCPFASQNVQKSLYLESKQKNNKNWYSVLSNELKLAKSYSYQSIPTLSTSSQPISTHQIHSETAPSVEDEGQFILTAYALDKRCTGKAPGMPGFGITSTGAQASADRTIAVDPSVIPYGTVVLIPGVGWRVAEDTGGAIKGHHIDVLVESYEKAIRFGVKRNVHVYKRVPHHISLKADSSEKITS